MKNEMWTRFEALSDRAKARAFRRYSALLAVADMVRAGINKSEAVRIAADQQGFGKSAYYGWEAMVGGIPTENWLAHLADHRVGRTKTAEMSQDAWDYFLADYLRPCRPSLNASYARTREAGAEKGWVIPSLKTVRRRLDREVQGCLIVLKREGEQAVKRLFQPHVKTQGTQNNRWRFRFKPDGERTP